jgi:uncharacterized protein
VLEGLYTVGDDETITLSVHAQPGAGRSQFSGRHGDALKVRVAAPPEGGRANAALVKLLAETLGVPAASVELVAGESSRTKRFRITGVEPDRFVELLEAALGSSGNIGPGRRVRGGRDRRPGA